MKKAPRRTPADKNRRELGGVRLDFGLPHRLIVATQLIEKEAKMSESVMKSVTEDQFEAVDDITIIHRPTGTEISAYGRETPRGTIAAKIKAGIGMGSYPKHAIRDAALPILRRMIATKAMANNPSN